MRKRYFIIAFFVSVFMPTRQAFPVYKIVRVNCKILKRNTRRVIVPHMSVITENESELVERSISILSDNAINEVLNLLKFYHMTNDASSSVVYIISYELIWVAYQLHKKNLLSKNTFNIQDKHSQDLLKQVVLNITLYIILKNMVINNLFSEINRVTFHSN